MTRAGGAGRRLPAPGGLPEAALIEAAPGEALAGCYNARGHGS
jgi:hypothetical protein